MSRILLKPCATLLYCRHHSYETLLTIIIVILRYSFTSTNVLGHMSTSMSMSTHPTQPYCLSLLTIHIITCFQILQSNLQPLEMFHTATAKFEEISKGYCCWRIDEGQHTHTSGYFSSLGTCTAAAYKFIIIVDILMTHLCSYNLPACVCINQN